MTLEVAQCRMGKIQESEASSFHVAIQIDGKACPHLISSCTVEGKGHKKAIFEKKKKVISATIRQSSGKRHIKFRTNAIFPEPFSGALNIVKVLKEPL